MPVLVKVVKNNSFIGPMTAGSGNLDFWWPQLLPQVMPVLWVPKSCLKMKWFGRNPWPIETCILNFTGFNSTISS